MRRDDVEHALDALASELPAPTADAASLIARGRRRLFRQRVVIIGIAAAVIATAAGVGAIANNDHEPRVVAPAPTTSTPPEVTTTTTTTATPASAPAAPAVPAQLAFASTTEGWICDDPFQYTTDAFETVFEHVDIPTQATPAAPGNDQQPLCSAAPDSNAWLLRRSGNPDRPELVRIRSGGADVQVFPFARIPRSTVESISFVDADNGWALVDRSPGQPDLYRTHDGGATWSVLLHGNAPLSGQLDFRDTRNGWASGYVLPKLANTTDGGRTWRAVDVPTPNGSTQFAPVVPALVKGNVVVAYGAWNTNTGARLRPFVDVSTDGGRTWNLRSGPAGVAVPGGAATHMFSAADAGYWALASANRLYVTDDGGRTWSNRAQFAGVSKITDIALLDARVAFVSGIADPSGRSTVVLKTSDAGDYWSLVDGQSPIGPPGAVASVPGGIIGCPTRALTTGLATNAIAQAALAYVKFPNPSVSAVYRGSTSDEGEFGEVFRFNVGSCGPDILDNIWVAYVEGVPNAGPGGSTARVALALAHYADGWHVFGQYP